MTAPTSALAGTGTVSPRIARRQTANPQDPNSETANSQTSNPRIKGRHTVGTIVMSLVAVVATTGLTLALWNDSAAMEFEAAAAGSIRSGSLSLDLIDAAPFAEDGPLVTHAIEGTLHREGANLAAQLAVTIPVAEGVTVAMYLDGVAIELPESAPVAGPGLGDDADWATWIEYVFPIDETETPEQAVRLLLTTNAETGVNLGWDFETRAGRHAAYVGRHNQDYYYGLELPVLIALQQIRPEPFGWSDAFETEFAVQFDEPGTRGEFAIRTTVSIDGEDPDDAEAYDYLVVAFDGTDPIANPLAVALTADFTNALMEANDGVALGIEISVTGFNDLLGDGVSVTFDELALETAVAALPATAYWVESLDLCVWDAAGVDGVSIGAETLAALPAYLVDAELLAPGAEPGPGHFRNNALTLCVVFAGFGYLESGYSNIATVTALSPLGAIVMHSDEWHGNFFGRPAADFEDDYLDTLLTFSWKAGLR